MNPNLEGLGIWDSSKMKTRRFNSIMPSYNHQWAAEVLGMRVNEQNGPDLIDDGKFVEIKFALTNPTKNNQKNNYPKAWTVLEHQMDYLKQQKGKRGYWGLGLYELTKAVKSIDIIDMNNLESLVRSRELFIVEWDWMKQFEPSHTSGKTEISEWSNTLRYPKYNRLPKITKTYDVNKGKVHLTEWVSPLNFNLDETNIPVEGVPF